MKTKLALLCAIIGICFCMTSCKSKIDSNIEKLREMEQEYVAACAEKDFDKARTIVDEMAPLLTQTIADQKAYIAKVGADTGTKSSKTEEQEKKLKSLSAFLQVDTHIKFINDKEIYDLLAHSSSDNNKRILYLYNSYEKTQLPDMSDVAEVAISQDNEDLATKLIKAGVEPTDAVLKAAVNADMGDLLKLCINKNNNILGNKDVVDYYKNEFGTDEFIGLLNKTLTEVNKNRPTIHSQGITDYSEWNDYKLHKEADEAREISNYNRTLVYIFNEALSINQNQIAREALNAMMPTIELFDVSSYSYKKPQVIHGITVRPDHCLFYYNYDQINELKKKLK